MCPAYKKSCGRGTAALLAALLILSLFMPASCAEPEKTEQTEQTEPIEQNEQTIHISTVDDLIQMAADCRLDTWSVGRIYVLDRDLDLGGRPFSPVPTFSGTFDGKNHKITGFVLAEDGSHQGFFRYIQAEGTVRNLTVEGTVTPDNSRCQVGGIAGVNYGSVSACRFNGTVSGLNYIGGIAGVNYGEITGCSAEGTVSGKRFTGGICGYSEGKVSGCRNSAAVNTTITEGGLELDNLNLTNYSDTLALVSAEDASVVSDTGGIAGFSSGILSRCRNAGTVGYPHYGYNTGGIVGRQSGYTFGCVNNGEVMGRKDVGGICGQMEPYLFLKHSRNIGDEIKTLTTLVNQALDTIGDGTGSISTALDTLRAYSENIFGELAGMTDLYNEIMEDLSLDAEEFDPETFDPDEIISSISELYGTLTGGGLSADAEQLDAILFYIETAMKDASDLAVEELKKVTSQGGVVMDMFSSALAGDVNVNVYDDVSEAEEDGNTDGRVEKCRNNGSVSGDTNVGGISGTMGIEYEFDMEGSILSAVDEAVGSNAITSNTFKSKCVCIANVNNGTVIGKKDCVGGINGLQDSGYITKCENYGDASSTDGGYVGGISGESCSVSDCYALCTLYGQEYVGGISGLADKILNCSSIVKMDDVTACFGAVAGYLNSIDADHLSGNTFVSDRLGAVDGISYSGLAEPVPYTDYAGNTALPELFRTMKLVFRADDNVVAEVPFLYGDSISDADIPAVPEKDGFTGIWSAFDRDNLTSSAVIDAVYTARLSSIESAEKRENAMVPLMIAEGDFTADHVLALEPVTVFLPDEPGVKALEAWSVSITDQKGNAYVRPDSVVNGGINSNESNDNSAVNAGKNSYENNAGNENSEVNESNNKNGAASLQLRYQTPELSDPAVSTLQILVYRNGSWSPVEYETKGSYSVFPMEDDPMIFCAVEKENPTRMHTVYTALGGGILLVLIIALSAVHRHRKNTGKET